MDSLKRTELRIDGRKERDVYPPKSFSPSKVSPCDGFLLTIYAGKPLTPKELPTNINTGGGPLAPGGVDFPTKRVADYEVTAPSAPYVCDRNGKPTADPSLVPTPGSSVFPSIAPSYPWDPQPSLSPFQLNPTP